MHLHFDILSLSSCFRAHFGNRRGDEGEEGEPFWVIFAQLGAQKTPRTDFDVCVEKRSGSFSPSLEPKKPRTDFDVCVEIRSGPFSPSLETKKHQEHISAPIEGSIDAAPQELRST